MRMRMHVQVTVHAHTYNGSSKMINMKRDLSLKKKTKNSPCKTVDNATIGTLWSVARLSAAANHYKGNEDIFQSRFSHC